MYVFRNVHTHSPWFQHTVKHGIPQGFVLGPLFFLLYINGLSKIISDISNPILFADDNEHDN